MSHNWHSALVPLLTILITQSHQTSHCQSMTQWLVPKCCIRQWLSHCRLVTPRCFTNKRLNQSHSMTQSIHPTWGSLYPFTAQKCPKPFQLHFWILCHFRKHSKYKIITYSCGSCTWIFQETNHFRTSIFPNQCLITRECENTRYTSLCANKMPMYRMITALFKNTKNMEKGFQLQIE